MCCGANEVDYHYINFNMERDYGKVEYVDVAKIKEGGICPKCGKHSISVSRGIEVGNIFQLGTKYTKSMGMQYLDKEGNLQYPIMGCYGIGVGRLAASVCESHRDDYGPIWPISIAPWQVHICCLRADEPVVKAAADDIYNALLKKGVEVIYDDRDVRAGVMFSDADLLGVPVRVVVSPRSLGEDLIELSTRDKKVSKKVPKDTIIDEVCALIAKLQREIEEKV
jgi:prolyl-tRNA synthetase